MIMAKLSPADQFGRARLKHGPGRSALGRANRVLKNLIQAATHARLRRIRQELELHGIRLDGPDEEWIARSLRSNDPNK